MRISDWSSDVCSSDLVHADGSHGNDTKSKVFWVEGCDVPTEPDQVDVPAMPSIVDVCNPANVIHNVAWDGTPVDTAEYTWTLSLDGRTYTATLTNPTDLEWSDGPNAPKVFKPLAEDGKQCTPKHSLATRHEATSGKLNSN